MIEDLLKKNRSYRRFNEDKKLDAATLRGLVQLSRYAPSAANLQELRYRIVHEIDEREAIFPHLKWANYLKDWDGPAYGQRPTGYILVLVPKNHTRFHFYDAGLAIQSMLLGATERGLGGCIIASMDREHISRALALPEKMEILLAIALGTPAEEVLIDDIKAGDNIEYWRDEKDRHHVPKLDLESLIVE